ncbi:hypothetical protein, partial [Actinomadura sp. HBU206391]|uniref:hypothetical protein n=1 Tax=Actinomadura sp. HBU206391 TaxID=2731692 RepID=UPI001C9CC42E
CVRIESPDGTRLASVGDHTVRIWATASGEIETTVRFYADPNDSRNPMDCCWLPNGRTLAVTSKQGLHLFDLTNTPSDLIDPDPYRVDRSLRSTCSAPTTKGSQ